MQIPTLLALLLGIATAPACGREPVPTHEPAEARPLAAPQPEPAPQGRTVAVTFDDLPFVRLDMHGPERARRETARLLEQLRGAEVPAVGFVNEKHLQAGGQERVRTAILEQWLDAGMELGNHTYAHASFWNTPLEEMKDQVLRGERVTRRLMAERDARPRFFRHPTLNTGRDALSKEAFERFLAEHGYRVAPVTIDNMDVMYALAYDNASERGDSALRRRIGRAYLEHMEQSFAFYEELSRRLLGREPAQVLMLHANTLNADYMDALTAMMRGRGYGFVTLERALEDPAYRLPDRYIGRRGLSWLQRWAITRGEEPGEEPEVPAWVRRVAYPRG